MRALRTLRLQVRFLLPLLAALVAAAHLSQPLMGVLILSRFAGAARELREALIATPYHVEETADAMHRALTMPAAQQREGMVSLRTVVRDNNVYRWAARMLGDAGRWRLPERIEALVQRHREDRT